MACPAQLEIPCDDGSDNNDNDLVDCFDPDCANDPACNPSPENCDDRADNDGNGIPDEKERACNPGTAPVVNTVCVEQKSTTAQAGGNTNTTVEPDGCTTPTGADSGEGETANVAITDDDSGVIQIAASFTADGQGALPNATSDVTVELQHEGGGSYIWVTAFGVPVGPIAFQATFACQSQGYEISGVAPERIKVPTSASAATVTCDVHLDAELVGPGDGTVLLYVGVPLARDSDDDGKSDRNDLCNGCPTEGTFGPGDLYHYACRGTPCAIAPDPNPDFCVDCLMRFGNVVADVGPGASLLFDSSGVVTIQNGTLGEGNKWSVTGESFRYDPLTQIVDCAPPFAGPPNGGCTLGIEGCLLCPSHLSHSIAARAALISGNPKLAQVGLQTDEPSRDGGFALRITVDEAPPRNVTLTTEGGVADDLYLLFLGEANLEALVTAGFAPPTDNCPGVDPVATFTDSFQCRITYTPLDRGDVVAIGVDGGETFSAVPFNYGPGTGNRFAAFGLNGVAVYREDNLSLVPSESELDVLGGFSNLLSGLFFDAPPGSNDAIFVWQRDSGALSSQLYEDGYSARQFYFGAFRSGVHRNGDPNSQEAIVVSNTGVQRLSFQDVGGGQVFLTSTTYVPSTALPAGYTPWAAFWTSLSPEVLIAAQSTTLGANGKVFRASPTTGFRRDRGG